MRCAIWSLVLLFSTTAFAGPLAEAKRILQNGKPEERAEAVRSLIGYRKEKSAASVVLAHLAKESDDKVKEAIWEFLKTLKDKKARKMVVRRIFKYQDADTRAQLLIVAWSYKTPEGEKAVLKGLSDEAWEVRQTAAELIAKAKDEGRSVAFQKEAILKLIKVMPSDENARSRRAMRIALWVLTGQDFGCDRKKWKKWWKKAEPIFGTPDYGKKYKKGPGMTGVILDDNVPTSRKTPRFFGEEIKKGRVIFVIDVSGSMGLQAESGRTKLEVVREELINAIKAMDKHYKFNIIFYSTGVAKWRPNLQKATEENKKAAIEFIKGRPPAGMTNIHGALKLAMEDAEVKLIILLTDGQPTAGITDKEKILEDVRRWNKYRRIQINTIGLKGEDVDPDFLRRLAEQNKGTCKIVK
ncbi:MAG: hypothetical protein DRP82_04370 [Planctomycetota bacterium]|nr:MAG: hypothetical protein DRP82_04370 [Planctomycetota bacterium]